MINLTYVLLLSRISYDFLFQIFSHKSYLTDLLMFSDGAKRTTLSMQGWSKDVPEHFDDLENIGFQERQNRFLSGLVEKEVGGKTIKQKRYRSQPTPFVERLQHALNNLSCPILPGVPIRIEVCMKPY